jgi:hypothetical protein
MMVIAAFELLLTERNGRTTRASRTRQKLKKDGVRKLLADLALKPTPSAGFFTMVENDMADLTFEHVVIRHSDQFDEELVTAARRRLSLVGVTL